jgi:four helix bundle protein
MSEEYFDIISEKQEYYTSILYQKAFKFSVRITKFYKYILKNDHTFIPLYKQLLRSGTSIGANVSEAQSASSKSDFANKLSIALKECRESEYWLKLLFETELINKNEFESLIKDCDELERILTSSIKTTKGL